MTHNTKNNIHICDASFLHKSFIENDIDILEFGSIVTINDIVLFEPKYSLTKADLESLSYADIYSIVDKTKYDIKFTKILSTDITLQDNFYINELNENVDVYLNTNFKVKLESSYCTSNNVLYNSNLCNIVD